MNPNVTLDEGHMFLFLIQFFLLLGFTSLVGLIFKRFNQPTVTGDVLVGIILGPSVFGRFLPDLHTKIFPADPFQVIMIDTIAWIGIFFLLLVTGLEVNLSSIWKHKGKATWIALSDIIIPILLSLAVLYFLPDRYLIDPQRRFLFILFISTIMTISAMPVSIRVMQDLKLLRTDLGFLTVSALSINDIVGWIVFTIILGVFTHGQTDLRFVISLVVLTFLFLLAAFTLGKQIIGNLLSAIRRQSTEKSGHSLSVVLLAGLLFGALTQKIGIHALFGFFVAGLVAGESKDLPEKTRSTIDQIVNAVFIPIFFANIGLKIDLFANFDLFLITLLTILGFAARFLGAYVGVIIAQIPPTQRWPISVLHTPGGEMHIVIAALAIELRLINEIVFVAIIASAIISTITLGPILSMMLRRIVPETTLQLKSSETLMITAESKYDALYELSKQAAELLKIDTESIYHHAKNREEGMSTALEQGIAIPHARIPKLSSSVVIFGRSERGIDWNSPDGLPAKLIFLIITPYDQTDTQLQIYRQLIGVFSKKEYLNPITAAHSLEISLGILNEGLRLTAIAG